jgi:hypothetical protein
MKHLQHVSEYTRNTWNMCLKHLQRHPKTLEKVIAKHMQHPNKHSSEKTNKIFRADACNIVYSNCNIYNIPIYFCNIHMKHFQHTSETSETLATCVFTLFLPYDVEQSRGTTGSSQLVAEDGAHVLAWPAAPASGLGPTNDGPLSWPPGNMQRPTPAQLLLGWPV